MLTASVVAGARLAQKLEQQGLPREIAVRFAYEAHGTALQPDSERAGNTTFQRNGRTVLLLDSQVSELLADNAPDLAGAKLRLQHPNEGE